MICPNSVLNDVAFVMTCKGRLRHVRETIPALVAAGATEIVLVDYSCPENVGDWVASEFPQVKVVRVVDDPGFCLPRARNIGAANSTAPWLCFIDADVVVKVGFIEWLAANLHPDSYYRAAPVNGVRDPETFGTIVCTRVAYQWVGGYDEAFRGWGGEDTDFYLRLANAPGLLEAAYPHEFVEAISHGDEDRTTFHAVKSKSKQHLINSCYTKTKRHLLSRYPTSLPIEIRQEIMDQLKCLIGYEGRPPKIFSYMLNLSRFPLDDGGFRSCSVHIQKKRRFGFFGSRQFSITILETAEELLASR